MITLNTIIYEGNFREFLKEDCWFFKFKSDLITKKMITINNVNSKDEFDDKVNELKVNHNFDLIYVSDHVSEAKKTFNMNINEGTVGYYYTMPYFITINNTTTKYLLNVASDCMRDIFIDDEFLNDAIKQIDTDPLCSSVMVAWSENNQVTIHGTIIGEYEERAHGILDKNDKFNYTKGFTDQFFMNSIDKLKKIDYNVNEIHSKGIYNGPDYGGNSFEKRFATHQIYNKIYNSVYKGKQYYIHDKV
jgi:hypothetical protein